MSPDDGKKIEGGYYLKARKVQKSWISQAPPHVREIWDWILLHANYKDHGKIKRGQLLTTYKDIQEGLAWFIGYRKQTYKKHHCEIAMKALTRERMVTTTKTTRGLIITILNYDRYQEPKNYECYNEHDNEATTKLQPTDTIRKERVRKEERNKTSMGEKSKPPSKRFTPPTIEEVFAYCKERKNSVDPQKWIDHYQAKGWMIGKNKMRDWKAAVRTWEGSTPKNGNNHNQKDNHNGFSERDYGQGATRLEDLPPYLR